MIRRRSTISIYDYPEHLNPFREERRESIGNKFRSFGQRGTSFRNAWNLLLPKSKRSQSFSRSSTTSPQHSYDTWTVSRTPRSHHEAIGLPASWTISPRRRYTPPNSVAGSPPHSPSSMRGSQLSVATLGADVPSDEERFQWQGARPKKRRAPLPPTSPTGSGSVSSHTSSSTSLRNTWQPDDTKDAQQESLHVLVSRIQQEFGEEKKSSDPAKVTTTGGSPCTDKTSLQVEKAFVIEPRVSRTPQPSDTTDANNSVTNGKENVIKSVRRDVSDISRDSSQDDDKAGSCPVAKEINDDITNHERQKITIHESQVDTIHKPEKTAMHISQETTIHKLQETIKHEPQQTTVDESEKTDTHKPQEAVIHTTEDAGTHKPQEVTIHEPQVANNVFVETTSRTISSDGKITITAPDGVETADVRNGRQIREKTSFSNELPEKQATPSMLQQSIKQSHQESTECKGDSSVASENINISTSEVQVETIGAFVVSTPDTGSVYEDAASEVDGEDPVVVKSVNNEMCDQTLQEANAADSSRMTVDNGSVQSFSNGMQTQTKINILHSKTSIKTISEEVKPLEATPSKIEAFRTNNCVLPSEEMSTNDLSISAVDSKTQHEDVQTPTPSNNALEPKTPVSVTSNRDSSFKITLKNDRSSIEARSGSGSSTMPRKTRTNGDIRRTPSTAPRNMSANGLSEQTSSTAKTSPVGSSENTPTPPPRNKPQPVPRMKRLRKIFSSQ